MNTLKAQMQGSWLSRALSLLLGVLWGNSENRPYCNMTAFFKSFFGVDHFYSLYWIHYILFLFFGQESCGILAPWPGIKFVPPALEEILTTGPPGKSQHGCFLRTTALLIEWDSSILGRCGRLNNASQRGPHAYACILELCHFIR